MDDVSGKVLSTPLVHAARADKKKGFVARIVSPRSLFLNALLKPTVHQLAPNALTSIRMMIPIQTIEVDGWAANSRVMIRIGRFIKSYSSFRS